MPEAAPRQLHRRQGCQPGGQRRAALEGLGGVRHVALGQRVGREDAGQARAAVEGAAAPAAASDGGEGRRQDEGLEARAVGESAAIDGLQTLGEVEFDDARAAVKGELTDRLHPRGDAQGGDAVQEWNAPWQIDRTLSGRRNWTMPRQRTKASSAMDSSPSVRCRVVMPLQSANAFHPMPLTLAGMRMVVMSARPWYAHAWISTVPAGTSSSTMVGPPGTAVGRKTRATQSTRGLMRGGRARWEDAVGQTIAKSTTFTAHDRQFQHAWPSALELGGGPCTWHQLLHKLPCVGAAVFGGLRVACLEPVYVRFYLRLTCMFG